MDRRYLSLASAGLAAVGLAGLLSAHGQDDTNAPRVLIDTTQGELVVEGTGEWCKPDLVLTVRAKEDSFLNGSEINSKGQKGHFLLQKLLGGVRSMLQDACPQAKSVTFNGYVDDVFVYRGYASKDNTRGEWVLINLPVGLVTAQARVMPATSENSIPRPESVGECDALAAHPDDPQKPLGVVGVSDDDMEAGKAMTACEEALGVRPDDPRLKYQLARAYLLYDKPADGVELMTSAAEGGHALAISSLGDFSLFGLLDDKPDPETAKLLYQKSAKAGYKPAAQLAADITADPKEDVSQAAPVEPEYQIRWRIEALITGKPIAEKGLEFVNQVYYGTSAVAGIQYHCPEAGVSLDEQTVNRVLRSKVDFWTLGAAGMDYQNGGYAEHQQKAMDDGYALAFTKGCASKEVAAVQTAVRSTFY